MRARSALFASLVVAATVVDPHQLQPATAASRDFAQTALTLEVVVGPTIQRSFLRRLLVGRPSSSDTLFSRPYGVAWQADELVVTDPEQGRVLRVSLRGRILRRSAQRYPGAIGVAACGDGFVVSDSRTGRVSLLDDELDLVRVLTEELDRPTGIACSQESVFVVETGRHRVLRLDRTGAVVASFGQRGAGDGDFNFPAALALDGDTLWVGDTLNFRIQQLQASNGLFLRAFGRLGDAGGETPRVKGIAIDRRGILWISDAFLDQVSLFRRDGTFLTDLSTDAPALGEALMRFPAGVAAHPDGRVAVVDSLGKRLLVFGLDAAEGADP